MSASEKTMLAALSVGAALLLAIATFFIGRDAGWSAADAGAHIRADRAATESRAERCVQNLTTKEVVACIDREVKRGRDDARAELDLHAQQAMARWAGLLLAVSFLQFFASAVGLFTLIKTLAQNQAALQHAKEMLQHERDTAARQFRPEIVIDSCSLLSVEPRGSEIQLGIAVIMKNIGAIAGTEITIDLGADCVIWPLESGTNPSLTRSMIRYLAHEQTRQLTFPLVITRQEADCVKREESAIYLRIVWSYAVSSGVLEKGYEDYAFVGVDLIAGGRPRVLPGSIGETAERLDDVPSSEIR